MRIPNIHPLLLFLLLPTCIHPQEALAKRLLAGRAENIDNEKAVLAELKGSVGGAYTSRAETMLNDLGRAPERDVLARVVAQRPRE